MRRFASAVSDSDQEADDSDGCDDGDDAMDTHESVSTFSQPGKNSSQKPKQSTTDKDQLPLRGTFQALSYNGGVTDDYVWSQDKKEVRSCAPIRPTRRI